MNLELTDGQKAWQKKAREFAESEVWPITPELDATGKFPRHLARRMGELGMLGLLAPKEYGGTDQGAVTHAVVEEEIGWADIGVATTLSNTTLLGDILVKDADQALRDQWLSKLIAGEAVGCFALTEPDAGSDASVMKTTAVRDGGDWVINGNKIFITHGSVSDVCFIFAMSDPGKGNHGITCFIADKKTPGLSVGKIEKKMGIRSSDTAELIFQNVRVPQRNQLGELNKGIYIALRSLDGAKVAIGALSVGLARRAFELAWDYAKTRKHGGRPIGDLQAIHFKLAEMITQIEAARFLVYWAAFVRDQGKRFTVEAAKGKMFASEVAREVVRQSMQIHGWNGYAGYHPVGKLYRDQRILEIWEGTAEINRMVIARRQLGLG